MFERLGGPEFGDIDISIDKTSIYFGFDNQLRREVMLFCLDVIANLLRDRIVNLQGVEVEEAAIHNEYFLNGVDDPFSTIYDGMHETMYERNPVRFRIDCEVEDLKRITPHHVRRFIKRHYIPQRTFLIAFGPKFAEVAELAKRYLGDWKSTSTEPALGYDHSDNLPLLTSVKSLEIPRAGIHQFHLSLGFPTGTYLSKDAEILDVLARIWAYRLRMKLREQNRDFNKGVYRVLAFTFRSFLHGLIFSWFATISEEFVKQGEEIALQEAWRFKQELVDERELDVIRRSVDDAFLYAFNRMPGLLAEMVVKATCNGDEDLIHLHSFRKRLHRITRRKLREVANKYFTRNYARILIRPV
jgi:predicted Zn-dependent peptidase